MPTLSEEPAEIIYVDPNARLGPAAAAAAVADTRFVRTLRDRRSGHTSGYLELVLQGKRSDSNHLDQLFRLLGNELEDLMSHGNKQPPAEEQPATVLTHQNELAKFFGSQSQPKWSGLEGVRSANQNIAGQTSGGS